MKKMLALVVSAANIAAMAAVPVSAESITQADVAEGSVINFDKGSITVTSDATLKELQNNLIFTKLNGTAVKGQYYVVDNGDGTFDVKFGDLEDGQEYKITYGDYNLTFKAKNGIVENFDDWTDYDIAKLKSSTGNDGLYLMEKETYGVNLPTVSLKADANGGKYLDLDGGHEKNQNVRFRLYASDFGKLNDEEGNTDFLQVYGDWKWYASGDETGMGIARGNDYRKYAGLYQMATMTDPSDMLSSMANDATRDKTVAANRVSQSVYLKNGSNYLSNNLSSKQPVGNTFNNYGMMWSYNGTAWELAAYVHGVVNDRTGYHGQTYGTDFDSVLLAYIVNSNMEITNASVAVDNIEIKKIRAPRVLKTDINGDLNSGIGEIQVALTADPKSVTTANFTLVDAGGTNKVSGVAYNADTRTATVSYSGLEAGSATLTVTGLESSVAAQTKSGGDSKTPKMVDKVIPVNVVKKVFAADIDYENYPTANSNTIDTGIVRPNTNEGLVYASKNVNGNTDNMYVLKDTDGNRFLRMYAKDGSAGGIDNFIYAGIGLDGKTTVSVSFKTRIVPYGNNYASEWSNYNTQIGYHTDGNVGKFRYSLDSENPANSFWYIYAGGGINVDTQRSQDDWIDMKLVFVPNANGKYSMYMYGDGNYKHIQEVEQSAGKTRIVKIYNKATEAVAIDIDDVKINEIVTPYIINTKLSETDGGNAISTVPASGNVYAEVTVNNQTGTDDNYTVILAAYDNDGKLLSVKAAANDVTSKVENNICKANITGVAEAKTVKAFVWANLGGAAPILLNPVTLTK